MTEHSLHLQALCCSKQETEADLKQRRDKKATQIDISIFFLRDFITFLSCALWFCYRPAMVYASVFCLSYKSLLSFLPSILAHELRACINQQCCMSLQVSGEKNGTLLMRHTIAPNVITHWIESKENLRALIQHCSLCGHRVMGEGAHCIRERRMVQHSSPEWNTNTPVSHKHKLPANTNSSSCMSHLCERLNRNKWLIWPGTEAWPETDSI